MLSIDRRHCINMITCVLQPTKGLQKTRIRNRVHVKLHTNLQLTPHTLKDFGMNGRFVHKMCSLSLPLSFPLSLPYSTYLSLPRSLPLSSLFLSHSLSLLPLPPVTPSLSSQYDIQPVSLHTSSHCTGISLQTYNEVPCAHLTQLDCAPPSLSNTHSTPILSAQVLL